MASEEVPSWEQLETFPNPALWLMASGANPGRSGVPSGNPFLDQFARYFPDLRGASIRIESAIRGGKWRELLALGGSPNTGS